MTTTREEYRRWYDKGWRSTSDLDYADAKGYTDHDGYLDGRTDAAIGLPKYHSETCPEEYGHDGCWKATTETRWRIRPGEATR